MDTTTQEQIDALEARNVALNARASDLARKELDLATMQRMGMEDSDLLPVDAIAGECYARVWVEPQFKTVSQAVLSREASENVTIIPARYETVTEQVLIDDVDYRIETVPAAYRTETEPVVDVARSSCGFKSCGEYPFDAG